MRAECKTGKKREKRAVLAVLIFYLALSSGCGFSSGKDQTTTLQLNKDGSIKNVIVEEFTEDYYSQDELKNMVVSETAAYDNQAGTKENPTPVTVEKVEVSGGVATVIISFDSYEHYAAYNQVDFFLGTVGEAREKGYQFNLADAEEQQKIVISEEALQIKLSGNVISYSDNVTMGNKKNLAIIQDTANGPAYITFN